MNLLSGIGDLGLPGVHYRPHATHKNPRRKSRKARRRVARSAGARKKVRRNPGPKMWEQKAFGKHPGLLHKKLGVKQGKRIPDWLLARKLSQAKKDGDVTLEREILLAQRSHKQSK